MVSFDFVSIAVVVSYFVGLLFGWYFTYVCFKYGYCKIKK